MNYIFTAKPITDGAHYSVTVDRNGTITTPRGGHNMGHCDMLKALAALGDEAAMKGRSIQVYGVTSDIIRQSGKLPHGCMTFAGEG